MNATTIKIFALLVLVVMAAGVYKIYAGPDNETDALLKEQNRLLEKQDADRDAAKAAEHKFFSGKQVPVTGKPFKAEW